MLKEELRIKQQEEGIGFDGMFKEVTGKRYLAARDISTFLEGYEVFTSEKEENAIMRVFDRDRDGLLAFEEFFQFIQG